MAYDLKYYGGVLATTGTPAATIGQNGDYALDLTTTGGPFIYTKSGGVWSSATSLRGPQGTAGTNGTNGTNGSNGTNGAPGNLKTPVSVTSNYTVTAATLAATNGILFLYANASGGNISITVDAAALWLSASGQTYVVEIKRIDTSANSVTITAGGSSTVEGSASLAIPSLSARVVEAVSTTVLYVS